VALDPRDGVPDSPYTFWARRKTPWSRTSNLFLVRLDSGEPSAEVTVARQRSIFSGVTSSTRIAPKAGTRWAETIER
jgi:hypothetical protein